MIGIIGAMDVEVELLVSKLQNKKEKKIANYNFYSGTIENKEVVVIKSVYTFFVILYLVAYNVFIFIQADHPIKRVAFRILETGYFAGLAFLY